MKISAELLRDLHSLHSQQAELQGRLDRGPRQIKAAQIAVDQSAAVVEDWHRKARESQLLADRKQLDLKSNEDRIADWKVQLNSCTGNKEYQTMLEQIDAAEMAGSVLQDDILELLERIDGHNEEAAGAGEKLKSVQAEMLAVEERINAAADGLRSEIARVEGELAEAEKQLPGEIVAEYRRVIRQNGAAGMSEVEEGACAGCGHQVSLNQKSDLILCKPVFCGNCGAMLYNPPE